MKEGKRKVIYREDLLNHKHYQLLKSDGNGMWNKVGKRKSVKGICDLLAREGVYNFEVDGEVSRRLDSYMMMRKDLAFYIKNQN